MSDDDNNKEMEDKTEEKKVEPLAMPDWEKSNINVAKPGMFDQPLQPLDHPEFEPDNSMVGKENRFGTMTERQKAKFGPSTAQNILNATPETVGTSAGSGPSLRQHGFAYPGQHLTGGLNYYTIYTTIDITPTGLGTLVVPDGTPPGVYYDTVSNSQYMLDILIETISLRAQPMVMSQITSMAFGAYVSTATPTFVPTSGTVWAMSFAVDHNGAWDTMQTGWTNSLNPLGVARGPIKGGPTPWNTNPDLTGTINANMAYMNPVWINDGTTGSAATNTFVVVSSGPF